jgi:sugar phosphate isomerase/epimerase
MISPENAVNQRKIIDNVFEYYRDRINVFHLKDFRIVDGVKQSAVIGSGSFDLKYLLDRIRKEKPYADLLLEELQPEDAVRAREYVASMLQGKVC